MSDLGFTTAEQFGSSGVAEPLGVEAHQQHELVARQGEPTAESQVFSRVTGGAELSLADGQDATTVGSGSLAGRASSPVAELAASRNDARRRLHELRHELLDNLEDGALDAFGHARLEDVERELDALDAIEIAASQRRDILWAKIEALAERVLASAPSRTPS